MHSQPTSDHAAIQLWAQMHGAHPAERLPERVDSVQPVLCFIFQRSHANSEKIIPISWEVFFDRFDLLGLSFIGDMDTTAVPAAYEIFYSLDNRLDVPLLSEI